MKNTVSEDVLYLDSYERYAGELLGLVPLYLTITLASPPLPVNSARCIANLGRFLLGPMNREPTGYKSGCQCGKFWSRITVMGCGLFREDEKGCPMIVVTEQSFRPEVLASLLSSNRNFFLLSFLFESSSRVQLVTIF